MKGADLTKQSMQEAGAETEGPCALAAPCGEMRFVFRESQHHTHMERRPSGGGGVTEHLGKGAPGLVWRSPLDKNDMSCVRASGAGLGEPSVDMELDPRKNQMLPGGSGFPASVTWGEVKHE